MLRKSLYGLKQSSRQWYLKFDEFMLAHGNCRSNYGSCVYYRIMSSRDGLYLLFYVDDMLIITCKHREDIERLTTQLSSEFEIKKLGATSGIPSMQIVKKVINRFAMGYSKPLSTPLATHFRLSKQQEPIEDVDVAYIKNIPYSSAVRSIIYAMLCFRPNLPHGIGVVSRFMGNPGKEH